MQKIVTVIIPTYNRVDQLINAVESVKAQTYPAVQIIVADDGSTDDTADIIKNIDGVEYYYQENRGQGAARNLGLKYAKGEYITSLDSDDIWHPDFLEAAVGAVERFDADFVFLNHLEQCGETVLINGWEQSQTWKKYTKHQEGEWNFLDGKAVRELFLKTCPAPSSALLIRRSSLKVQWNETMKIADDWCLILEMVLVKPCRAAFTMTHYWIKTVHNSNIYHGREEVEIINDLGLHDEPLIAERFDKQLTLAEKSILKKRIAGHYLNIGRLKIKRDGFSMNYLQYILTAFKVAPFGSVLYLMQLSYHFMKNQVSPTEKN